MEVTWALLSIVIGVLMYGYTVMKKTYRYWEERGVPSEQPLPLVGNIIKVLMFQKSLGDIYEHLYKKFPNEKVIGIYQLMKPSLIVRDPRLIEKILIKDFQYFMNHSRISEDDSLFGNGLFQLRDSKWRAVRAKVSPAFTSGKLKMMFSDMIECADQLVDTIRKNVNKDYEIKEDLINFTLDVVASTVFGIQITDKNKKKEFGKMGNNIFEITPLKFLEITIVIQFPKLAKLFGLSTLRKEVTRYFKGLIETTFEQRKDGKYQRNDYVQQLLKLKEKGAIEVFANEDEEEEDEYLTINNSRTVTDNIEITEELLAGQAFQFLSAGVDPLNMTMMFVMYDLACNPEIQERVRLHIKGVLRKHGTYSYEAIKDMKYLEQCIQESMRLHTLFSNLIRQCTKRYVTEDGIEIDKDIRVVIPINAIHLDPEYYPDPERYNPDRLPPNSTRNSSTFLPFGDGPRICIGLRYALLEMKIGLAKILENFKFTLSPKTKQPFDVNKQSFILLPRSKFLFHISPVF